MLVRASSQNLGISLSLIFFVTFKSHRKLKDFGHQFQTPFHFGHQPRENPLHRALKTLQSKLLAFRRCRFYWQHLKRPFNINIASYKKKKHKILGALSRVRLYYPPASGGIELTQERGILGEIYIGKIIQIIFRKISVKKLNQFENYKKYNTESNSIDSKIMLNDLLFI